MDKQERRTKTNRAHRALRQWARILQLTGYVVRMRLSTKLELSQQYCDWEEGNDYTSKSAIIGISLSQSPDEIEHSIAHELSHILRARTRDCFAVLLENTIRSSAAWETVNAQYNDAENEDIEHNLRVLYALLGKSYPPHRATSGEIVADTRTVSMRP